MAKQKRRGSTQLRKAAWELIVSRGEFTRAEMVEEAGLLQKSVYTLIKQLLEEGAIVEVGRLGPSGSKGSHMVYRLTWRFPHPPHAIDPVHHWQRQAWMAMRIMRRFKAVDLLPTIVPEGVVKLGSVKRFCERLAQQGVLRREGRAAKNGASRSHTIFFLVKDTGPDLPVEAS